MASNGVNPTTGSPLFPEEDAPAQGADLEEVAAYAAFRGNLLRLTATEMADFDYPEDGLVVLDRTNKSLMRYDGGFVQHGIEHLGTSLSTSPLQGPITTTPTAVSSVSVTASLSRTSNLRVRGRINTYSSVASDVIEILLKDGSTTVSKWTVPANSSPTAAATSQSQFFEVPLPAVTSGSHTYTVQVVRVAGSGNISIAPAADQPNWLTVERYS